jgi:3-methylfumaryl-CoA hydratase
MTKTDWQPWVGRTEAHADVVTPTPVAALTATLDRDDPRPASGDPLPPPWHWLDFLPLHRQSELGPDGQAKRGGFLPPVPLPRRMWAANADGGLAMDATATLGGPVSEQQMTGAARVL